MLRSFVRSKSRGVELIELALLTPFLVAAVLAIFDVTNIVRTNMALGEATSLASVQIRALDTHGVQWTPNDPRIVSATESAQRELLAVLPRARFDCGEPNASHCATVAIEPHLSLGDPSVSVQMQYALPVLIVGSGPRILTRTVERRLESSYAPRGETQIGNPPMQGDDEDEGS